MARQPANWQVVHFLLWYPPLLGYLYFRGDSGLTWWLALLLLVFGLAFGAGLPLWRSRARRGR